MATAEITKAPIPKPNSNGKPRLTLAGAVKGGTGLPSRVVLHGVGGIGKTSWAAHAPKPYFLLSQGETGLQTLIDNNLLPEIPSGEATEWADVKSVVEELRTKEHEYKTLVIDTADGLIKLANAEALQDEFEGKAGPTGWSNFAAGDRFVAANQWLQFLNSLDRLRAERKMAIILLAHTNQATYRNPKGPDYDRFVPAMYKDSWTITFGWADITLFGHFEVDTEKQKGATKGKATGCSRVMSTAWDPTADAKNRIGMTDDISMGETGKEAWANFAHALSEAKRKNKEQGA